MPLDTIFAWIEVDNRSENIEFASPEQITSKAELSAVFIFLSVLKAYFHISGPTGGLLTA